HNHPMLASADPATTANPQDNVAAATATATPYFNNAPATPMSSQAISAVGGSQPHNNFQPYLCVDFIISLFGIFPSQTWGGSRGRPVRRRDPHLPVHLLARRLGAVRRAAPAALAEHCAVLAARHDLWRQRQEHLRAARLTGTRPHASRSGPRLVPA